MHCPLCTAMVRGAILKVDGAVEARATLNDKKVKIITNEGATKQSLLDVIKTTGYEGKFIEDNQSIDF
ncbi:heavy-metal-associated domain-containing protein [Campylobacter sp. FMV-PI01]|uniref:Heavy-metal-associated domain-containing protein n=2 Tax=Campylobacter portucalensis TaxID=2608384 RepID=A0A6L5WL49_9BACT|nr:heavy-metal-associated domain-containing protein [Campylobacter portucalensis]